MPINLADFERGAPFTGDFHAAVRGLQDRLARLQLAQLVHGRRAVIVFEGQEGAGKKAALRQLGAGLDPCHYAVHCLAPDRRRSAEGHWLARFWSRLPSAGGSAIYFHSWYRRVLEDRAMNLIDDKEWKRGFDEINEFESQQRDYGTLLIKLYFHAADAVLDERIARRAADPWQQHLLGPAELRSSDGRDRYRAALARAFEQTDTRWAPWTVIDAGDEQAGQVAALAAIAEAFEQGVSTKPPERAEAVLRFPVSAGRG